jgi:chromosome segregation protein
MVFLKRLEAYGFKSFAKPTKIVFEHGIIGVVGPNGSGKSNINDAIR